MLFEGVQCPTPAATDSCILLLAAPPPTPPTSRPQGFKVCMVDPACCCMWSGHLVANFVYQPHRSITGIITWFISRDLHTAAAVQRNFFWTKLNLWPQEMPEHAVMVLSGQDDLVPVPHVEAMLRHETKARVLVKEGYKHADFLFDGAWQDTIVDATLKVRGVPQTAGTGVAGGRVCGGLQGVGKVKVEGENRAKGSKGSRCSTLTCHLVPPPCGSVLHMPWYLQPLPACADGLLLAPHPANTHGVCCR